MDNRVALITGGAQGVGEATARRLLADGVKKLALADMNVQQLNKTVASLNSNGAQAIGVAGDLSQIKNCENAVATVIENFGRIDILANCAGSTLRGGLLDTDEATFDTLISVNVKAPLFLMQHAAKHMIKQKCGVIVSISSILAHGGLPMLLTYSATKAALVTMTKSAANTLKSHGIRVFAINLGWTVTPHEHKIQTQLHNMPENWAEQFGAKQPLGRLLHPEDPAGVISFLCSKDASMMTGAVIDLEQHVVGTSDAALGAL